MKLKEAKDKAAIMRGHVGWHEVEDDHLINDTILEAVAELYARSKWDEAIKAYEKLNNLDVSYYDKPEFKP